ncbi:MAG: hypothetical protein RL160_1313 [Bacteroidota bacterium]|jgi:hypothetical protein
MGQLITRGFLPVLLGVWVHCSLFAQATTLAAGGTASHTSGAVSYSIGQLCYLPVSDAAGSMQQGVQQAWSVTPSGIWEIPKELYFTIYPNPAGNQVHILGASVPDVGQVLLYDAQGVLRRRSEFNQRSAICSLEGLPSGSYFLMLYDQNQLIYTATLIKSL